MIENPYINSSPKEIKNTETIEFSFVKIFMSILILI